MNKEMTVYGNSSKDTMTVTNISSPVNDEDSSNNVINNFLNDESNATNSSISDPNWSTNNFNNSNSNSDINQSEETFSNPDDALEPIDRLEKYSSSEIIFHRQVVARSILETLSDVEPNDIERVMGVISRLASDTEPSIRAELIEQIPQIGTYFANQTSILPNAVPDYILPILEQFLTDSNSQVRKMTQNAFVMMLEQGLIKISFLEEHICPLLIQLTDFSNLDDYRMEAVGMMSKIVRFMGKELTEKLLLQTFNRLCLDVSFHVRRVCAANFGDFCSVVGQELTENILLSQFRNLCQDSIWGVRKSCADVFVPVAIVVSNRIRKQLLSPLFVNLLCDQSRWVKIAAFQALGPFISTFADPSKTGLYYCDSGVVVIEDHASNDSGCSAGSGSAADSPTDIDVDEVEETLNDEFTNLSLPTDDASDKEKTNEIKEENCNNNNEFSHFFYWRVPILDLEVNEDFAQVNKESCQSNSKTEPTKPMPIVVKNGNFSGINLSDDVKELAYQSRHDLNTGKNLNETSLTFSESEDSTDIQKNKVNLVPNDSFSSTITTNIFTSISTSTPTDAVVVREPLLGLYPNKSEHDEFMALSFGESMPMGSGFVFQYRRPPPLQDIIPNDLLEHYLSMTNPIHFQTIDPDLSHHCAYSLPAVALTLGRQNWACLRETYELLAAEMQWKVRWTLASSLHQMSLILGTDLTTRDLLPIFLSFMKDLDEVRFGILQNLASFLKLLLRPQQQGILPKISEFLKMDNNRNWRFRYNLAKQIVELANLYNPSEIREYLLPIGLVLLVDKVSEVRLAAIRVISVLIKQIFQLENSSTQCNRLDIIEELNTHFGDSSKWIHRQTYILLCEQFVRNESLPIQLFIDEMLEHLLNMSDDNVPNIRLVLARCIANTLWPIAQFRSHLKVQQTLEDLQSDRDKDVRNQSVLTKTTYESTNLDNY